MAEYTINLNRMAFIRGYLSKQSFLQEGGPTWTGYTAETPTTTATDDKKEGKDEHIYNEGTPWGVKDYGGGGEAGVIGLPKGAASVDINAIIEAEKKAKKKESDNTVEIGRAGKAAFRPNEHSIIDTSRSKSETKDTSNIPPEQSASKQKKKVSSSGFPGSNEGIGSRSNIWVDFSAQNKAGGIGTRKEIWESTMKENKDAL